MVGKVDNFILDGLAGSRHCNDFLESAKGSNVFNAYTRACYLLRKDPQTELASRPIELEEPTSTIGRYLINIINDSQARDHKTDFNFISRRSPDPTESCEEAEENFYIALGHKDDGDACVFPEDRNSKNKLFVDNNGIAVLFKKAVIERNTLALEDISLNGIYYPKGTVFTIQESRHTPSFPYQDKLDIHSLEDITNLGPLRMSKFALPEGEQLPTMTLKDASEEILLHCGLGLVMSMRALTKYIPPAYELEEIVNELPDPAEYNKPAWQPNYATA